MDSTVERLLRGDADDADRAADRDVTVAAPGPDVVTAAVPLDGATAVSGAAEGEPAADAAGVLGGAEVAELVHPPVSAIADASAVAAASRAARRRKRFTAPR